jgi:hypothetical protein
MGLNRWVTGAHPQTPTVRQNLARLAAVESSPRSLPAYSRWVNRPLARAMAAVALRLGVGPALMAVLATAATVTGLVTLVGVAPGRTTGVIVAVALAIGFMLDSADLMLIGIRRATRGGVDRSAAAIRMCVVHLAVLVAVLRSNTISHLAWPLIGVCFLAVAMIMVFGLGAEPSYEVSRPRWLRSAICAPADYGMVCWVFLLLGSTTTFLIAYSALLCAQAVIVAVTERLGHDELSTALREPVGGGA